MTPSHFTCTWLLLPFCVLVTLSTGELEFRQDGVPENLEDLALTRQLNRYLEAQANQRSRLATFLTSPAYKKHHFLLELSRQMQRDFLEALAAKTNTADVVRKYKLKALNYHRQYNDPINETPNEREYELPYYELNPLERGFEYPNQKFPHLSHKSTRENGNFKDQILQYPHDSLLPKHAFYEERDLDKRMKEEAILAFPGNHRRQLEDDFLDDYERKPQGPTTPDFTFNFDDSNLYEKHPFAVKPNDPRYYKDTPFSLDDTDKMDLEETLKNNIKWDRAEQIADDENIRIHQDSKQSIDDRFKDVSAITLPGPERRTGYHPLIVPVTHDLNNDIYFIAIVAGCSAAAMFALVLVSLTWCRLQRGAKAAADIEYPAYGVTGPNKDVSPSGDQRLAQSAQMYHFQHQKQQIIAMENRTSATRDTGSVSEAESDEENEEGDYTVYECPGLASTGEMEVKNPLFHDDPTPATPAQTNKEEDHI